MEIHTSDNPAKEAGERITEAIATHEGDVLCLLSGGSALDVIEHINITEKNECRTIFVMGDERVSGEATINNYLQLTKRYSSHPVTLATIRTVPAQSESASEFADRIEKNILQIISESKNLKIISLLGIGADGHTAGVFPMSKESFQETYKDDRTYVGVHVEGLTIDSRASITPTWILSHVDEILLFAAGESKHAILESLLNETKELHERPSELLKLHRHVHLYTDMVL